MRLSAAVGVLLIVVSRVPAEAEDAAQPKDASRRASLVFGYGNSVGGVGAGAEAYVARSRLSLFGAVGYVPSSRGGRAASGVAVAVGARVFTGGRRHRGFAEISVSPAGVEIADEGSGLAGEHIIYGPGFSLGYQFVASSGVTVMVAGGIAYGLTGPDNLHDTYALSAVAVGYTWRRKSP